MTLWIGNSAVLKGSSQWQLTEFKKKNSWWELFNFQQAISPSHTAFTTLFENLLPFSSNLKLSSASSFSIDLSKFFCLGKG